MYVSAPVNAFYRPQVSVAPREASIEIDLSPEFHHPLGAAHGSIYFKMLDDAAFFAAASLEREVFLLTASFTIHLFRPVSEGVLRAEGRVLHEGRTQYGAASELFDAQGRRIAAGSGVFLRSRTRLADLEAYRSSAGG
ncbi:MAG: PaaI family thioesterase [Gemmatimonadetes bacterium]|nr:MAG: PaaI family thioesterase [Gemmatimonadota bacterium]